MHARPFIDSLDFARNGQQMSGELPIVEMLRLTDVLSSSQGMLSYTVQGGVDRKEISWLDVSVVGICQLRCQRCLSDMAYEIQLDAHLFLRDQAGLDALSDDEEEFDSVLAEKRLDLLNLLEEEILLNLRKEINRSGMSARNIFVRAENIPEGLTVFHVENLVRGLLKKTRREYMEFVLSEWKKQADTTTRRIPITPEMFAHMLKEKERTGFGPMALLHGTKKDRPQGLTTSLMDSWLAGRTKSARKDHLDFVLRRWEEMPGSMKKVRTIIR